MTAVDHDAAVLDLPPVTRDWWSWAGVQGGYIASLLVDHGRRLSADLPVRSVHASFLRPVEDGALRLSTETVRRTGGSALTRGTLLEVDRPSVLTTSLYGSRDEPVHQTRPIPDVAAPEDCPVIQFGEDTIPFARHVEVRPAGPGTILGGGPEPRLAAWIRLREPGPDPWASALIGLDSMPPALYALITEPVPVPTVEFSVHFTDGVDRDAAPTAWRLIEVRTEQAGPRWTVDSGALWDEQGTLLALSRQTRRVLRAP